MVKQPSFAELEYQSKKRLTRREITLAKETSANSGRFLRLSALTSFYFALSMGGLH